MRITRRKAGLGAAVTALALALTACGSDDGDGPEPDGDAGEDAPDLAGQMVGAMEEWGVGDTFVATEPLTFELLYRDHPNYPYNDDWLFFTHLEENHNVSFDIVNVPLSDYNDRRNLLLGAGDAPELVPIVYAGDETQFVGGGGLLPVSDTWITCRTSGTRCSGGAWRPILNSGARKTASSTSCPACMS